jgi:magnesium chelatase subunit D
MTGQLAMTDTDWVAGILGVVGAACGGVVLKEAAEASFLRASASPLRQLPSSVNADVFIGTLDLAATLALGKPVRSPGLLNHEGEQWILVRRAESLEPAVVSHFANLLDEQRMVLALVSGSDDQDISHRISDRLAFAIADETESVWSQSQIAAAKLLAPAIDNQQMQDLCAAAVALGITSPRSVVHAVKAAQAIAALQGLEACDPDCVSLAARLVFAHRATRLPAPQEEEQSQPPPPQQPNDATPETSQNTSAENTEVILNAVRAAIPQHLLQSLAMGLGKRGSGRNAKSKGPAKAKSTRGRRLGSRRSQAIAGQRLDVIATLRNAAPWQPLRRRLAAVERMIVTRDDFQIHRIKQRNESAAIFAVDASGSTAFQRLAEAKGAVEAILAECYVRRDKVALVSFRSKTAEELLPPTRSLERARRALTALPGGGGTPLASGLDKVFHLADQVRRQGTTPIVIILTDGRANVTRAGEGNKVKALEESESAARLFATESIQSMVIDVSPEPQRHARKLAENMGGNYFAMPRAGAADIARPVTAALRTNR